MAKIKYILIITPFIVFTISCEKPFDFSPYDTPSSKSKELNANNIKQISKISTSNKNNICFAIISDSHIEYDLLKKSIKQINNDKQIQFVIHLGDITTNGLQNEFEWANKQLEQLEVPYIVVIGNHDYLSNGSIVYQKIFGAHSFSFITNNTKFVIFDNVVWENNNSYPNFDWLNNNLSDNNKYNQIFVFSHIPPFSDQFDDYCRNKYYNIMQANNVSCSFHGHIHCYSFEKHQENNKTWYFTADDITSKNYYKVTFCDTTFNIQAMSF